jgi:DNA-binding PadR family transcriptional regulator
MVSKEETRRHLPMAARDYLIMLLLEEKSTYGYELLERLEERSDGTISLNAGSLYRAIARLVENGLVKRLEEQPGDGGVRKLYAATALGRRVVRGEMARQASLLRWSRRFLPDTFEGS